MWVMPTASSRCCSLDRGQRGKRARKKYRPSLFFRTLLISSIGTPLFGCKGASPPLAATPPPAVSVAPPLEREVLDYEEYTGHIAAVEEVEVRSRVRGYLVKVNFVEGTEVKQGDVLFEIARTSSSLPCLITRIVATAE